jgi:hypothetical protein
MPKEKPNKSETSNGSIRARIVDDAGKESYEMFEAHDVSLEGAFLAGPLFLEVDEEFTVEFGFGDDANVRVKAVVTGIELDDKVGMSIGFPGLTNRERRKLEARLGGD